MENWLSLLCQLRKRISSPSWWMEILMSIILNDTVKWTAFMLSCYYTISWHVCRVSSSLMLNLCYRFDKTILFASYRRVRLCKSTSIDVDLPIEKGPLKCVGMWSWKGSQIIQKQNENLGKSNHIFSIGGLFHGDQELAKLIKLSVESRLGSILFMWQKKCICWVV